ncbi:hypothetical protein [Nonomuraea diastatica]|uniref:Uncharacterized protein n=1 Tax=Nonomuraea diastatica TaxID=1848329 RepID=A0A4R4WZN2_9ACTN|nr:hypothetical protein [Nonomuraea diastatica]TDD23344.1 hypothetical protein E1294_08705 [Nonomuraea diastatica]
MNLRVGDLVEVRGEAEILATLDERGELESLPFMPEMARFCGRRMTVHKVAHKLCDTISRSGMRRMERAVHLTGARCDGGEHGGCQTACSLYWKEAWLKRVDPDEPQAPPTPEPELLPLLRANTRKDADHYSCQATELLRAAPACLPFRDLGQYVTDVRTGNAGVASVVRAFLAGLFNRFQELSKKALPRRLWIRRGLRWGFVEGRAGRVTPTEELDLKPGELVRIRSKKEILDTLNADLLNRGLGFEEEMARYCGRTARVRARVERCLDEKTGRMLSMKSPCIVLDDLVCEGVYNANCPREFVPFWREIWLERLPPGDGDTP